MKKLFDLDDGREVYTDGKSIFVKEDSILIIPNDEEAKEICNGVDEILYWM